MRKCTVTLLLLSMLLSLAACGSANPEETDSAAAENTNTSAVTDEGTRPMHKVAESDYEGSVFNTAYPEWQGYVSLFFAEEATGDVMNDAIYSRTTKIEEYLNVDLQHTVCGYIEDVVAEAKNVISAGDDVYSQILTHCIAGNSDLSTGGYLYNLDTLPNIDLSADWWNKTQMDILRLGKNTYFGVSDYMIPCPYAIFFNKEIVENNNMESPYDLVYEGRWTLDTFLNMVVSVVRDLNGDGQYTLQDDIVGVGADELSKYISFMTGAGQYITEKGKDGRIQLALNTEKTISLVEKISILSSVPGYNFCNDLYTSETISLENGRLLFMLNPITGAETMREFDVDIGIVPYPKYDEEQENYISLDWGGLMSVPVTIKDPEMVGAVLELQAWESKNEVIPTYYDVLLGSKLVRDEQTVDMLDILFDTITYEVGGNYFGFASGVTDLFYTLSRLVIAQNSTDFASWYIKNEDAAAATIDTFYESLDEIEQAG